MHSCSPSVARRNWCLNETHDPRCIYARRSTKQEGEDERRSVTRQIENARVFAMANGGSSSTITSTRTTACRARAAGRARGQGTVARRDQARVEAALRGVDLPGCGSIEPPRCRRIVQRVEGHLVGRRRSGSTATTARIVAHFVIAGSGSEGHAAEGESPCGRRGGPQSRRH